MGGFLDRSRRGSGPGQTSLEPKGLHQFLNGWYAADIIDRHHKDQGEERHKTVAMDLCLDLWTGNELAVDRLKEEEDQPSAIECGDRQEVKEAQDDR